MLEKRFRHLNYVRDLPAHIIDEPPGLLGDDTAPNPSEAVLAALGSCISWSGSTPTPCSNNIKPAQRSNSNSKLILTSRPVWGTGDLGENKLVGFSAIRVKAHVEGDAPREKLDVLIAHSDSLVSRGKYASFPRACHGSTRLIAVSETLQAILADLRSEAVRIDREGVYPRELLKRMGEAHVFCWAGGATKILRHSFAWQRKSVGCAARPDFSCGVKTPARGIWRILGIPACARVISMRSVQAAFWQARHCQIRSRHYAGIGPD